MATRNPHQSGSEEARPTFNSRLPVRRARTGLNALTMGPQPLVQAIQATQGTSAVPQAVNNTGGAKRNTRVQELRGNRASGLHGTPTPPAGDPSTSLSLNFNSRRNDATNLLVITPNSSTLLASPIGSSPIQGAGSSLARGRKSRSRSTRRNSTLGNGSILHGGPYGNARTPSRGRNGDSLYLDGDTTGDSSAIGLSPIKLNIVARHNADRSMGIGLESIESIDIKEDESAEFTDEEDEDEDEEDEEWGLVDRMRLWRHDAMTQHLYETAVFWGDKVMNWTNDPSDAFWLAQVHFQTGEYARAERLLTRPFIIRPAWEPNTESPNAEQPQGSALPSASSFGFGLGMTGSQTSQPFVTPHHPQINSSAGVSNRLLTKGKMRDTVYDVDPFFASVPALSKFRTPANPGAKEKAAVPGLILSKPTAMLPPAGVDMSFDMGADQILDMGADLAPLNEGDEEAPIVPDGVEGEQSHMRLVDVSVMCRYLAAQCQVRQGKWAEALEVLGEENPFRDIATTGPHVANRDGGIKLEASMCHLRGVLYMRLNRVERAKNCFLEALALDIKCFEAFNTLIQCQMLTIDEEWELIQGLRYKEQTPEDADFIRMMYTVRLKKLKHSDEISRARKRLTEDYGLGHNCDILYTLADSLYAQLRFADCFIVTSRIMEITGIHLPTIPLHVACMYHLKHLHSRLFILAHELVDKEPESAMSWYAVGVWYLVASKWREAKQYLSKTTIMDSRHAPGWMAFAHTFAKEGEHEHAITAYSTCARLFRGSHLPHLFIGMEHITLSHMDMASDALEAAQSMCDTDPLVYNERGVVAYLRGDYQEAVQLFEKALGLAKIVQDSENNWISTYCNLGTAQRKLGNFVEAKAAYEWVLRVDPRHANALASLGMVHHMSEEFQQAIQRYHEALSVEPLNSNVLELLNMALASGAAVSMSVPDIAERVASATQIKSEQVATFLQTSLANDKTESVEWDMPYGAPSSWLM